MTQLIFYFFKNLFRMNHGLTMKKIKIFVSFWCLEPMISIIKSPWFLRLLLWCAWETVFSLMLWPPVLSWYLKYSLFCVLNVMILKIKILLCVFRKNYWIRLDSIRCHIMWKTMWLISPFFKHIIEGSRVPWYLVNLLWFWERTCWNFYKKKYVELYVY